jgi:uncharacterized membrane-anchored protein YitT (DUF2179 family)
MVIGSMLIAVAINGFLRPHGFLSGGMAGTSLIVYYQWQGIPFGVLYFLLNIPVFALGFFVVGRRFILFSLWAVLIHSAMFSFVVPDIIIPDKLLSALAAGIISGAGVAIILRTNGTCSGTEIISIIINKFYSVNLSTTNLVMNGMLMGMSCFFLSLENVLYSFVFIVMNAQVMNAVFKGLAKRKAVMIISREWKKILDVLTHEKKIGVTLLNGRGGYSGVEEPILYSIVKSYHVSVVRLVTMKADPAAFIVIMETTDIINDTIGNQPPWKKQLYQERHKKPRPYRSTD